MFVFFEETAFQLPMSITRLEHLELRFDREAPALARERGNMIKTCLKRQFKHVSEGMAKAWFRHVKTGTV